MNVTETEKSPKKETGKDSASILSVIQGIQSGQQLGDKGISQKQLLLEAFFKGLWQGSITPETVSLFVGCGLDINATKHNDGFTALHWAAQGGLQSVVEALLKAGANFTATSLGVNPLHCAAANGHADVVKLFAKTIKGINLHAHYWEGLLAYDALGTAAKKGHKEVVQALVEAGADPDKKYDHMNALLEAAHYGKDKVVEVLLELGANPNVKDSSTGGTPLHWATVRGHAGVAAILVKNQGVHLEVENKRGKTAMQLAKKHSRRGIAKIIENELKKRQGIKVSDKEGKKAISSEKAFPQEAATTTTGPEKKVDRQKE